VYACESVAGTGMYVQHCRQQTQACMYSTDDIRHRHVCTALTTTDTGTYVQH